MTASFARLGIADKESAIEEIEAAAASTYFWDDPESASRQMQSLSALKAEVRRWRDTARRIDDALELAELEGPGAAG